MKAFLLEIPRYPSPGEIYVYIIYSDVGEIG